MAVKYDIAIFTNPIQTNEVLEVSYIFHIHFIMGAASYKLPKGVRIPHRHLACKR